MQVARRKLSKLHIFLIICEILYTAACFPYFYLVLKYGLCGITTLIPLLSLAFLSVLIVVILPRYHPEGTTHDTYIRDAYPDIWRRFHRAPIQCDPVVVFRFCRGIYDDGTDEKLNAIKFSVFIYEILSLWPWPVSVIVLILTHGPCS